MSESGASMSSEPPWLLETRSSKGFTITVIGVAIFTDVFLYGLIVPVVPFALRDVIGVGEQNVQTQISVLLAVYGGATLVGSPVVGYFADKYNARRGPFLAGLGCLVVGTLFFVIGRSFATLVAARALQGFSAAAVWVIGLSITVDTFGKENVGEAMGVLGTAMTLGILSGPTVGGFLFQHFGYVAVFVPVIVLLILDIVMRLAMIDRKEALKWQNGLEPINVQSDSASYGALTTSDHPDNNTSRVMASAIITSSQSSNLVEDNQHRESCNTRTPKFVRLILNPRLCAVFVNSIAFATVLCALDGIIPFYLMRTLHWNSADAGLAILLMAIPSLLGVFVGRYVDRRGPRVTTAAGFAFMIPATIILAQVSSDSRMDEIKLGIALVLAGLGACALDVSLMVEICQAASDFEEEQLRRSAEERLSEDQGVTAQAYSLFNTAMAGGQFLGPVLGGLIKNAAGWHGVMLFLGALSAMMTVPAFLWTNGWIGKSRLKGEIDSGIGDG